MLLKKKKRRIIVCKNKDYEETDQQIKLKKIDIIISVKELKSHFLLLLHNLSLPVFQMTILVSAVHTSIFAPPAAASQLSVLHMTLPLPKVSVCLRSVRLWCFHRELMIWWGQEMTPCSPGKPIKH